MDTIYVIYKHVGKEIMKFFICKLKNEYEIIKSKFINQTDEDRCLSFKPADLKLYEKSYI